MWFQMLDGCFHRNLTRWAVGDGVTADMGRRSRPGSPVPPKKLKENLMNRPVERRSGGWIETRDRPAV
jgi:hypothetical protein